MNNPSFVRWAIGEAEAKEAEEWDLWIQQSQGNRELALEAQRIITGISFESSHLSYQKEDWKRIEEKILAEKRSRDISQAQHRTGNSLSIFLKAAAILLVVAMSGAIALYMQQGVWTEDAQSIGVHTVSTEFSEKKTISLPDGSEIILASGSELSYQENWLQQPTLRVTLHKGEAFFAIQPNRNQDAEIPRFEVETEDGTTSVMGTRFTVSTYGAGTQVVLEEGKVRVTASDVDENDSLATILAPGEMATWSKHQTGIEMREVNPRVYTSWISNELFFDDTPLLNLVHRIERTYGVDVEVEDPELLEIKLSGAVDFYSLEALINAVSEVLNISITQVNDTVIIEKTSF